MIELDPQIASAIRYRVQLMREWLAEQSRSCLVDQREFEVNTAERTYWHFGYEAALQDILDCVGPLPGIVADDTD